MSAIDRLSILNHVIGPVMRGPSSSHTAGAWRIGRLGAALLGAVPRTARITFDSGGSYARTFTEQGADLALICGLLDIPLTDPRYFRAAELAAGAGLAMEAVTGTLERADHPNALVLALTAAGGDTLTLEARSVGGGAVELTRIGDHPLHLDGALHSVLITGSPLTLAALRRAAGEPGAGEKTEDGGTSEQTESVEILEATEFPEIAGVAGIAESGGGPAEHPGGRTALLALLLPDPPSADRLARLRSFPGVETVRCASPVLLPPRGEPLFTTAAGMVERAEREQLSLGRLALRYEAALLGLPEAAVRAEIARRLEVMLGSVRAGLAGEGIALQLLEPSAAAVMSAETGGRLPGGGMNTRAAARALAVMHIAASRGVICAAPTGGSAGVLPAVLATLMQERDLAPEAAGEALLAAGAIGLIVARTATFAAEVAGCQVEIGAAGAMAAAAVVEAAGGGAARAADAAAIALQNTMGSVCDLVQGIVEIPCHTRNAAAASDAFVCADLILGGYRNPIGLDDTLAAVRMTGAAMPPELRCTARGGLAATPAARALRKRHNG